MVAFSFFFRTCFFWFKRWQNSRCDVSFWGLLGFCLGLVAFWLIVFGCLGLPVFVWLGLLAFCLFGFGCLWLVALSVWVWLLWLVGFGWFCLFGFGCFWLVVFVCLGLVGFGWLGFVGCFWLFAFTHVCFFPFSTYIVLLLLLLKISADFCDFDTPCHLYPPILLPFLHLSLLILRICLPEPGSPRKMGKQQLKGLE